MSIFKSHITKQVERTQIMRALAHEMSLEFEEANNDILPYLEEFSLFKKGKRKEIRNLMKSKDQWMTSDFYVFDYYYQVKNGKNHRKFSTTVFFANSKRLALPEFLLRPENLFHNLIQYMGFQQDIDFEEHPEFSENYLLQGDDEAYIRNSFDETVLKYFTVNQNWTLEGVNYYLVFYKNKQLLPPHKMARFIQKSIDIFQMLRLEEDEEI